MSEEKEIKVDAKAETITNEKTRKQNDSLNALKEKKAKAEKDAEKAYEQAVKEKEEKERLAREEAERIQREKEEEEARKAQLNKEILSAGAALAASAIGSTVVRKKGGFLKGLLFGLIFGLLIGAAGTWWYMRDPLPAVSGHTDTSTVDADLVIEDDGFLGFTAADFEDAVLGGASEHQELIVMEQPLSIQTTITKAGLGNWAIFSKVKDLTYYGTGVYTVDLSHIDGKHITVDNDTRTVYIKIPHTKLQYINPDLDKTEFEDTEKGLLAWGDITLTTEEQNELSKSVIEAMRTRLDTEELYEQADEFAVMKTWEIFQPLVTKVSPQYKVEMIFED